jgi:hypothetical protein
VHPWLPVQSSATLRLMTGLVKRQSSLAVNKAVEATANSASDTKLVVRTATL